MFTLMENHFFNQGMYKYLYTDFEDFFQQVGGLLQKIYYESYGKRKNR